MAPDINFYGDLNLFFWANLRDYEWDFHLQPARNMKLMFEHHYFTLDQARDAWYTTGMSDPQLHVPPPFPAGPEQSGRMTKNRIPSAETEPKRLMSQGRAGLPYKPSGGMRWCWRPAGIWVAGDQVPAVF